MKTIIDQLPNTFFSPTSKAGSMIRRIDVPMIPGITTVGLSFAVTLRTPNTISPFFRISTGPGKHSNLLWLGINAEGMLLTEKPDGKMARCEGGSLGDSFTLGVSYSSGTFVVTVNNDPVYAKEESVSYGDLHLEWGGGFGKSALSGSTFSDFEMFYMTEDPGPASAVAATGEIVRPVDQLAENIMKMTLSDFLKMVVISSGQMNKLFTSAGGSYASGPAA